MWLWTVLSAAWAGIVGLLLLHAAGVFILSRWLSNRGLDQASDGAVIRVNRALHIDSTWKRIKITISDIAEHLTLLTALAPFVYISVRRQRGDSNLTRHQANTTLYPMSIVLAATQLLYVLASLPLLGRGSWQNVLSLGAAGVAGFALFGRYVHYIVGDSLPKTLRTAAGSPYALFVCVAVMDFVSITFIDRMVDWRSGGPAHCLGCLVDSAGRVLTVSRFRDLVLDPRLPGWAEGAVVVLSLCFYAMIVRSATQLSAFKRTDEDLQRLANAQNAVGSYSAALETLSKVRKASETTNIVRAASYIGLGRHDDAWDLVASNSGSNPVRELFGYSRDSAAVGFGMIGSALPLDTTSRAELVKHAIQHGVSDPALMTVVGQCILHVQDSSEIRAVGRSVLELTAGTGYGLTRGLAAQLAGDIDEARAHLSSYLSGSNYEEAIRRLRLAVLEIADMDLSVGETNDRLRAWRSNDLLELLRLVGSLDNEFQRMVCFELLVGVREYVEDHCPELREVIRAAVIEMRAMFDDPLAAGRLDRSLKQVFEN